MLDKICTNLGTSKRLKELGIEGETEFYWRNMFSERNRYKKSELQYLVDKRVIDLFIPAYTLEQILKMLPEKIDFESREGEYPAFVTDCSYGDTSVTHRQLAKENLATTAAKILIKLKEDKII